GGSIGGSWGGPVRKRAGTREPAREARRQRREARAALPREGTAGSSTYPAAADDLVADVEDGGLAGGGPARERRVESHGRRGAVRRHLGGDGVVAMAHL